MAGEESKKTKSRVCETGRRGDQQDEETKRLKDEETGARDERAFLFPGKTLGLFGGGTVKSMYF